MPRPTKHAPPPPPLYISHPLTPYCYTCGRVIDSTSDAKVQKQEQRYCSARCRREKPGTLDRRIEGCFVELLSRRRVEGAGTALDGRTDDALGGENFGMSVGKGRESGKLKVDRNGKKGDERVVVMCSVVEDVIFGEKRTLEKDNEFVEVESRETDATYEGTVDDEAKMGEEDAFRADEGAAGVGEDPAGTEEDHCIDIQGGSNPENVNDTLAESARLPGYGAGDRPAQVLDTLPEDKDSEIEASEDPKLIARRLRGQRRAQEREMVRRAARRGVVFGFIIQAGHEKSGSKEISATKPPQGRNQRRAAEEAGGDGAATQTESRRKCEVIIDGIVVEPSFAKGDWGIRWRE